MNVKRDKITDALDAFWGAGSQTELPSPEVDDTPEDMIETIPYDTVSQVSQEVAGQPMSGSKSVKEMVEAAIKNKQNKISTQPSSEIVEQYSPKSEVELRQRMMPSEPTPPAPKGAYGFAGFDQKLANQFAMERGGGIDLGGPMAPRSKLENQFIGGMTGSAPMGGGAFGFGMGMGGRPPIQREDPRLKRRADLALDNYAKQMGIDRQMRMADMNIARSQQAQKARYQSQLSRNQATRRNINQFDSGLPVYENFLDPLFGGKTKTKEPVFSTSETKIPKYKDIVEFKDQVTTEERWNEKEGKMQTFIKTTKIPIKSKEFIGFETKIDKKYAGMQEKIGKTPGFFGLMAGGLNTIYDGGANTMRRGKTAYERDGGMLGLKYNLSPEGRRYAKQKKDLTSTIDFVDRMEKDKRKVNDLGLGLSFMGKKQWKDGGGDIPLTVNEGLKKQKARGKEIDDSFVDFMSKEDEKSKDTGFGFGSLSDMSYDNEDSGFLDNEEIIPTELEAALDARDNQNPFMVKNEMNDLRGLNQYTDEKEEMVNDFFESDVPPDDIEDVINDIMDDEPDLGKNAESIVNIIKDEEEDEN